MNKLPAMQSKILDNDQLSKHRACIAVKAQGLMSRYYEVPQDEYVKRDILMGWMDMLQDYTQEEITKACMQYLIDYPNRRPHEGLILKIILANRKHKLLTAPKRQIESKSRKNPDAEQRKKTAEEIMSKFRKIW